MVQALATVRSDVWVSNPLLSERILSERSTDEACTFTTPETPCGGNGRHGLSFSAALPLSYGSSTPPVGLEPTPFGSRRRNPYLRHAANSRISVVTSLLLVPAHIVERHPKY